MRYDRFALLAFALCMLGVSSIAMAQEVPLPATSNAAGNFEVSLEDAQDAVANAIVAEGVADKIAATVTSTRQKALYHSQTPINVEVKTLKLDEAAKSFSANLIFLSGQDVLSAMPISGRYDATTDVPVLSRAMKNGEVIQEADLSYKPMALGRLRSGSITDVTKLVGATPRRSISANRPVREDEVQTPSMVKKGSNVQMTYQTPHMTVQTMGEALEDGSEGARIRVRNNDSHTVVFAEVRSESEVVVGPTPQVASVDRNFSGSNRAAPAAAMPANNTANHLIGR